MSPTISNSICRPYGRKVVGMITDRDVCMAGAMRERSLSHISVEEIMNKNVYAAEAEEDIEQALQRCANIRFAVCRC